MMGGCCGVERGSRGRWRKPLRISVHGEDADGGDLERRSAGDGVGCADWRALALSSQRASRRGATLLAAVVPQVGVHGREDPHLDLFSSVLAARNGPVSTCTAARFAGAHHDLA